MLRLGAGAARLGQGNTRLAAAACAAAALLQQRRGFSATPPLLGSGFTVHRNWHPNNTGRPMKLVYPAKNKPNGKKYITTMKMVSSAGHPWSHYSARRSVANMPEKATAIMFDAVLGRRVLFHERKDTGVMKGRLKFTQ
eukprot:TRINITY_DN13936_c0_g1_i1.p1 TRINITY_DN13936_c0_g1~~TRINITY_DN13936_c0_g1_i1.p1  ORF type:complete len:139 (+),score=37.73 TRINITY_DN13936_c0_g1_i1:94-510(+)